MSAPRFFLGLLLCTGNVRAIDQNTNGLSDVWELLHGGGLLPAADDDHDGFTNLDEARAATDPRNGRDFPSLALHPESSALRLFWRIADGKRGQTMQAASPAGPWIPLGDPRLSEGGAESAALYESDALRGFFRLDISDADSDGDTISDWEELALGFNPRLNHSGRNSQHDSARAPAALIGTSTISIGIIDDTFTERWPDPGCFVLRRTGTGLQPLTVNVAFSGTSSRGEDYAASISGDQVTFALGQRAAFVEVSGLHDESADESDESVILTVLAGTGYTVGTVASGTVTLLDQQDADMPTAKSAARFLIQAAFGPDQDAAADTDQIPENVEQVMTLGFEGWIDDQFTRPLGKLEPFVRWCQANENVIELYGDYKQFAWWNRVMGYEKLRPDDIATQLPDPLRQRVAFALSQILVVSDRTEDLGVEQRGLANYYDLLVTHSFGNYRDLLRSVALHPCMGMYLSHLGNRKPDPANRIYPDENFAREIMQLFSIGLWELNPDGTRRLDLQGQPIPSYSNADITEYARVFTGLSFGQPGAVNFSLYPRDFTYPMKGWDAEHDLNPKQLLRGLALPARTASPGNEGAATLADVTAAVDGLVDHPNSGPFLAYKLIQRLITSNPTPAYVGRVAAAFADNGQGVRGDMKAVVKAILLDEEARSGAQLSNPAFGKLREPLLRIAAMARAFNAASQVGWYPLDSFTLDVLQEPLKSPSVFNFFLPNYTPPGELPAAGLVAPEFQLMNASSSHLTANYFFGHIRSGMHRWGTAVSARNVVPDLTQEMTMIVPPAQVSQDMPDGPPHDPDALIRRLDLALCGGSLSPGMWEIVRENTAGIGPGSWQWHHDRLRTAVYLILNSADFTVQR